MFIEVTAALGNMKESKIHIVVDKVFGVCYSDTLKVTVIMTDTGHSVPVKESVESIKIKLEQSRTSSNKEEV